MHTPAALQKLYIGCLAFELSELKFLEDNYLFDGFFKSG